MKKYGYHSIGDAEKTIIAVLMLKKYNRKLLFSETGEKKEI